MDRAPTRAPSRSKKHHHPAPDNGSETAHKTCFVGVESLAYFCTSLFMGPIKTFDGSGQKRGCQRRSALCLGPQPQQVVVRSQHQLEFLAVWIARAQPAGGIVEVGQD